MLKTNFITPIKLYVDMFKTGDPITKVSFFILGLYHLANQQIIKGLLFLLSEVLFVYFMVVYGFSSIRGFFTLGTQKQGWKMDETLGIKVQVAGDNSMLMLIYGLVTFMIIFFFIVIYLLNLKSTMYMKELKSNGSAIPSLREELKSFLDERFHITLLSIPVLGVIFFTILPLIYMILLAFTNYDHNHLPPKNLFDWVGFEYFGKVLNGNISGTFFPLLGWTLIWAIAATATSFFFGVVLALLINKKGIKGKKIFRTIFVITIAVPQFISLLIMRNMLHISGPINSLLESMGFISQPIPFLTDSLLAKISVITVNMWVGIPVTMLVATAVLMNLSDDQYEAARIDGANAFQIFKSITFPQILFIMTPSLIQQFIGNINNFNVIYLLTEGTPYNSNYYSAGDTDLLVTWLFKLTVERADYNLASVIGIFIFVLSAVFSLIAYTRSNSYKKEDTLQ